MPIKRPQLITEEIYHIIIRGTGDSLIFKDEPDYYRGIYSLYEFNNSRPVEIAERRAQRKKVKITGERFSDTRDQLIEILCFCFMPNHVHLLVRQIREKGISDFVRKFGAGYAGHFNKKYNRKGPLFAKFRAVHIKDENQFKFIFVYIHTNPISLIEPKWKEIGIENSDEVINFLENYKWSSYPDYLGKENFSSVTKRDFLLEIMDGKEGCRESIENWTRYKESIRIDNELTLE